MDVLKTFVKVAARRTIKPQFVSLIVEEDCLNMAKGRVIKQIRLSTFKQMTWPFRVLVTVTKKGLVLIDPVLNSDCHIVQQGAFLSKEMSKKGVRASRRLTI